METQELHNFFASTPSKGFLLELQRLRQVAPDGFAEALKVLADGSRNEASREAYGTTGLLNYFMELQAVSLDFSVRFEALRAIANACADNNNNRDLVIASPYFGTVLENLSNERVAYVTLAALYNISLDYEPVQRTLRQNGIFLAIMAMLEDPIFDISSMMFHLTGLLSSALEDYDVGQSPDTVLRTLLHYTTDENLDLEELGPLRDAVLLHLKDDYYRALLVKQNLFESLLVTILRSCGYKGSSIYGKAGISSTDEILWTERLKEEVEDFEDLQTSLLAAMRDLSSTPTFWEKYPFEHQMTTLWLSWLESGNSHLQLISCCFLSNMARAKVSWAERMLGAETKPLYTKLVELSLEDMGTRISLAALEFLLQLARPKSNRTIICTFEFLDKLSRIWTVKATTPGGVVRAQYASVAVLIGLISDCLSAALCLTELSEHATGRHSNYLSALLTCFEQISDNKVKIEIAKVIMLLCRHMIQVHKDSENPDSNRTDSSTNSYKDLLRSNCFSIGHVFLSPVAMVISQTENPGLQAQGFFALVIVARQDGGLDLVRELVQQSTVLESLAKAIAEKPVGSAATSPSADADLADRSFVKRSVHENARWLLREYVNREDPHLSSEWRALLSDLDSDRFDDTDHIVSRAALLRVH